MGNLKNEFIIILRRLFLMLKPISVPPRFTMSKKLYTVTESKEFCPKKWMYPSTLRARPQSVFEKVQEHRMTAERQVEARFAINNSVFKTVFFFFFFYLKIADEMKYGGREGSETEKSEGLSCLVCPVCWRPGSQHRLLLRARFIQTCTCLRFTCLSEVYSLCLEAGWFPAKCFQVCQGFFKIIYSGLFHLFWDEKWEMVCKI